jgi:ubiquinone/menaquinone biosynthesis C-methylase UbiE
MVQHNTRAGDFNGLAANYERYRIGYSPELFDFLETLGLRRGAAVLDAGCGTGLSMEPLSARGVNVTGIDPSSEMLAIAAAAVPAATVVAGSVEQLPFADATFDAAVCAQAFHWFDADRAFAELIRVVKPGGPVAIWWKVLGSDEALRSHRSAACASAGLEPGADPLRGGFGPFYRAPFANRMLRVLPFRARASVDDWLGYESSRAVARNTYGDKGAAYIEALRRQLLAAYGSPAARIDIRYTQFLYVGTTAKP